MRVTPPSLDDLETDWVAVLGGIEVYRLSLSGSGQSRLLVASLGAEGFEIITYEIEDLLLAGDRISFVARQTSPSGEAYRVRGTASYWELRLVFPRSAVRRKRELAFFRSGHLERGLDAIDSQRMQNNDS